MANMAGIKCNFPSKVLPLLSGLFLSQVLSQFLCFTAVAAADSSVEYQKGQQLYAAKDYSNAIINFDIALKNNPQLNNANIHYMKADCLLAMGKHPQADREYAIAETFAPQSQLAIYCKSAREKIKQTTKSSSDSGDEQTQSTSALSLMNKNSGGEHEPQNANVPPGTFELIRTQAKLARERAMQTGAIAAENERLRSENEARSLQARLERQASMPKGATEPVTLSPGQLEAIKGQSIAGAEQLRQQGEFRAAQRKFESEEKSEEIRVQAENLQSQLINYRPNINSDIKLNPIGTNLYIRNYSKGIDPILPLKAQPRVMTSDKNATRGIIGEITARQTSLNRTASKGTYYVHPASENTVGQQVGQVSKPAQTTKSVKGQLLTGQ
jgi:hypothetical protein